MAKYNKFASHFFKLHPNADEEATTLALKEVWSKITGNRIVSQPVAEFMASWVLEDRGGEINCIIHLLNNEGRRLTSKGKIDNGEVQAINASNPNDLLYQMKERRDKWYEGQAKVEGADLMQIALDKQHAREFYMMLV